VSREAHSARRAVRDGIRGRLKQFFRSWPGVNDEGGHEDVISGGKRHRQAR
jgi:hypothetical protein